MRWTWRGGSSLWRSPWSSTRGWSVKHWLSSRAIVRGWRTCSSAQRLRWALARVANGQIPPRVCLTRVLCHDEDGFRVHLSTSCIYVKSEYCRYESIVILGSWWHLQPVSVSQGKVELSRAVVFPVTWQQEHQEAEISCQSWRFTPFMKNKTEHRSHLWGKSIQKGLKSNKCH